MIKIHNRSCYCKKCNEEREYRKANKGCGIKKPKKYPIIIDSKKQVIYTATNTPTKYTLKFIAQIAGTSVNTIKKFIEKGKLIERQQKREKPEPYSDGG